MVVVVVVVVTLAVDWQRVVVVEYVWGSEDFILSREGQLELHTNQTSTSHVRYTHDYTRHTDYKRLIATIAITPCHHYSSNYLLLLPSLVLIGIFIATSTRATSICCLSMAFRR